jgi:transposase
LTDDEWELVEPLIPPGKTGGLQSFLSMRRIEARRKNASA